MTNGDGNASGQENSAAANNESTNDAANNDISAELKLINAIKLPSFLQTDPELWFTQVDGILHLNRITSDVSKYYTVITALDAEALRQVSDVAKNPPETGKYEKLKKELISRFGESKERQLSKLMSGLELGNKKPSNLLREMRELAGDKVSNDCLNTLWMQRMPSNIRCILTAIKSDSLDDLADIADRIQENVTTSVLSVAATSSSRQIDTEKFRIDNIESRLRAIQTSIQQIMSKLTDMTTMENSRESRNRVNSRNRSPSQRRINQKVCYYHIKFGAAATKCQKPCEFNSASTDGTKGN